MIRLACLLAAAAVLASCGGDQNQKPKFGDSGLPSNCRAFVQYAIDEYRARHYTAEATMASLERNCGSSGHLWAP